MLARFIGRWLNRIQRFARGSEDRTKTLQAATEFMQRGDRHAAVGAFLDYLDQNPYNIQALNDLGACLADIGNTAGASAVFERAYALDDAFIPVVVNHAKLLNDSRHSTEALSLIRQAKIRDPESTYAYTVYAGICLSLGDAKRAQQFQLRAWLSSFDHLRLANSHLFYNAYADIDEKRLAAEHSFWAETLRPVDYIKSEPVAEAAKALPPMPAKDGRIRIGYWSPDFRNHSVRFFFRPLLENHDASKLEVVLYHDFPGDDAQTAHMYMAAPHFYKVCELSDAELYALIKSHDLDILVELAGHSSHNRLSLLQERFAPVQISALGYPPTTGLKTMDAKVVDRHILTTDSSSYYSEFPLALASSFWCFDPMEDAPVGAEPPLTANGYVTFACVGNIAKINPRMLRCWKQILDALPDSRLLLRSISFEDDAAMDAMHLRLQDAEIDIDRVDCHKPAAGAAYFSSYNEVDIILDTFPFNGGTTTCFATYMGVPVVSLTGQSLISRMGFSILENLGVADLAVDNEDAYVACAIALACNKERVRQFKREARQRFAQSSLGNGALFAKEFETACVQFLQQKKGNPDYAHSIEPLPADELVRRAYAVMRTGQEDAAQRILNYCLRHYPDCGGAHLLVAQQIAAKGQLVEANDYLHARLASFAPSEQVGAMISLARQYLQLGERGQFEVIVARLSQRTLQDSLDRLQVRLFQAQCAETDGTLMPVKHVLDKRITVIIPCDDTAYFAKMETQLSTECLMPEGCSLQVQRCDERSRAQAYQKAMQAQDADVLVLMQKNIHIYNPAFFHDVLVALEDCDVLGFAGAMRWNRMDWREDTFAQKAAGFVQASAEEAAAYELQWLGETCAVMVHAAAVLDGSLMAVNLGKVRSVSVDDDLEDAGLLMEEDWSHELFRAGLRIAIHRNLGVVMRRNAEFYAPNVSAGRLKVADKYAFDPFAGPAADYMTISTPIGSTTEAQSVMKAFLAGGQSVSGVEN